jgi:hypothetical protein
MVILRFSVSLTTSVTVTGKLLVENPVDAVDTRAPERLELVEQAVHVAKDTGYPPDPLLTAVPALDDEPRPLEHRHVLLHRREAHRVAAGQLGDRLLLRQHDRDDVATGGVGERVEHVVGATYNHMVVR